MNVIIFLKAIANLLKHFRCFLYWKKSWTQFRSTKTFLFSNMNEWNSEKHYLLNVWNTRKTRPSSLTLDHWINFQRRSSVASLERYTFVSGFVGFFVLYFPLRAFLTESHLYSRVCVNDEIHSIDRYREKRIRLRQF